MNLKTRLGDGHLVSTVQLFDGTYETMVFPANRMIEEHCERTCSEFRAKQNHAREVFRIQRTLRKIGGKHV